MSLEYDPNHYFDFAITYVEQQELEIERILDVGCGYHSMMPNFIFDNPDIALDCIDHDSQIIQDCASEFDGYDNINFKHLSAYELDKLPCKYDLIICQQVMRQLKNPLQAIEQMRDKLTEHGVIALAWRNYRNSIADHCETPIKKAISYWFKVIAELEHCEFTLDTQTKSQLKQQDLAIVHWSIDQYIDSGKTTIELMHHLWQQLCSEEDTPHIAALHNAFRNKKEKEECMKCLHNYVQSNRDIKIKVEWQHAILTKTS